MAVCSFLLLSCAVEASNGQAPYASATNSHHSPNAKNQPANGACPSDEAMQKNSRIVEPCVKSLLAEARRKKQMGQLAQAKETYRRVIQVNSYLGFKKDYAVTNEAVNAIAEIDNATLPKAQTVQANGRSAIPSGTYKCFTATTGRILAGGGGAVVPGSLVGSIIIKGDTYQVNEHSWGHYKVGGDGKISWNGGEYSSKTLGRYVVQNGTPTIVIGYADTDAGSACTPR